MNDNEYHQFLRDERRAGRIGPSKPRVTLAKNHKQRFNRKYQIRNTYANCLDEAEAYTLERLELIREVRKDIENEQILQGNEGSPGGISPS